MRVQLFRFSANLCAFFAVLGASSIAHAQSYSVWTNAVSPAVASHTDTQAVELGVKFRAAANGYVTAIRFYKGPQNTGTHVGTIWSSTGGVLGRVTFTNETASGWQQATFSQPVPVTANAVYVASYHAPNGRYAKNERFFSSAAVNNQLRFLSDGESGPNGLYRYGTSAFPTSSYEATNYWVDVVFTTSVANAAPTAADDAYTVEQGKVLTIAAPGVLSNDRDSNGDAITAVKTSNPANGTLTFNANGSFTFTPNATFTGTTTFNYQAKDSKNAVSNTAKVTINVTPAATSSNCPCSIWGSTGTPSVVSDPDATPVELGVKFRSTVNGYITGIRFYKGSSNGGAHTGTLWSASGSQLAKATFTSETASGWQQVNFASPVAITANTTYVASYFAPQGRFSKNENFFGSATTKAPLKLLANGEDGPNGVFRYGSSGFPSQTHLASNYWVDVVFTTTATNPNPTPTPISLVVTPGTASLTAGKTQQFTVSVAGTSNTAVSWSVSPAVGTVNASGLYTAPASITSKQTVTVTATSAADTSKKATATLTLNPPSADTTAPVVSFASPANGATVSGTTTLTASASDNVGVVGVQFKVDGANYGGEDTSAPFNASWNTGSVSNGSHTVTAVARDAAGNLQSSSLTLNISNSSTPSSKITLPIEVFGPVGTTTAVQMTMPAGAALDGNKLFMQLHGFNFPDKIGVQVNNSAWISLNNSTATLDDKSRKFGGIGGGFAVNKVTVNIPAGALTAGSNTVRFRLNTAVNNGLSFLGFRVIRMNVLNSAGAEVLPADAFVQENPNTWQPPLNTPADIAEGKRLYQEAQLLNHPANPVPIKARCADCHTNDGRDLKYFNYSNQAIYASAISHGLNDTQGKQIASYIRSLTTPNPGRPWNPPYQPGPGLDTKPVTEWAAGAGIDAVLERDMDTLSYIQPAQYAVTANLNPREVPVALQLPDWNHWLPKIHPKDMWGDAFLASDFAKYHDELRSGLRFRDPISFRNSLSTISFWDVRRAEFQRARSYGWTPNERTAVYGTAQWKMVKLWGVMQEFELEEFGKEIYGTQADSRAWWDHDAFLTSPNMIQIPGGTGLGNGSEDHRIYLAYIWYHLQLVLNSSNGKQGDNAPIDWPYVYGFVMQLGDRSPQGGLLTLWMTKAMQISNLTGKGPEVAGTDGGWQWRISDISQMAKGGFENSWNEIPDSTRAQIIETSVRNWVQKVKTFTPQQFYSGGHASTSESIRANMDGSFGQRLWYAIPRFKVHGASQTLVNEVADWAKTVWPQANWSALKTVNCQGGPMHYSCSTD